MAIVTIVIEDLDGAVDVQCRPESPATMVQGVSRKNTLAQNLAAVAMLTIEANARNMGARTVDLSEPALKQ